MNEEVRLNTAINITFDGREKDCDKKDFCIPVVLRYLKGSYLAYSIHPIVACTKLFVDLFMS